jgi:eukaryotic-like serine/threonine-protein kinase
MPVGLTIGGRYELLERVGRGGTSVVWRARDAVSGRSVAVKMLAEWCARDGVLRRRLRHEAELALTVSHPAVVRVTCYGEGDPGAGIAPFLVMEFVDGVNLQDRLRGGGVRPVTAMRIGAGIASALVALHACGVVHCDVKPSNVMVAGGAVKLLDLGIAAVAGSRQPGLGRTQVLGTPQYVAPERLRGAPVRPPADVYALGVLLYRLLADGSPWTAEDTMNLLLAHVSVQPAPIPAGAEIPPTIRALCSRCLAKDPASRPTAREAEILLGNASGVSATPSGRAAPLRHDRRAAG